MRGAEDALVSMLPWALLSMLVAAAVPSIRPIRRVHLIESAHFDAGFTDSLANVMTSYNVRHVPWALKIADELRQRKFPNGWALRFMAQSYYISFALDCPSHAIACPSLAVQQRLREGIRRGDVTWHAYPHNAELGNISPEMLAEGLALTHALDDEFGLPRKRSLSQRDVPGMPLSVVPLLKTAGVDFVSVGVNTGSMYPVLPRIFRWRARTGEELVATWHPRGYGGFSPTDAVELPGFDEVLVTDWNHDNRGPNSAQHVEQTFRALQKRYPNASIVGSTFDEYLANLEASGLVKTLPVVQQDIGDSWIYGVPSDPHKAAESRALERALRRYLDAGGPRDAPFLNFSRWALKNAEHTWGLDVKSTLHDDSNWTNAAFESARVRGGAAEFAALEASWWEQRHWGIDYALAALPPTHALAKAATSELVAARAPLPYHNLSRTSLAAAGFSHMPNASAPTRCGDVTVAFDSTGALAVLRDEASATDWAAPGHALLQLEYHAYSQADYATYIARYSGEAAPPAYMYKDFGKPGDTASRQLVMHTRLDEAWVRPSDREQGGASAPAQTTFLLRSRVVDADGSAASPHLAYGAPESFVIEVIVQHKAAEEEAAVSPRVAVRLWASQKQPTRLPEALFVRFVPAAPRSDAPAATWEASEPGGAWVHLGHNSTVTGGSKWHVGVPIGGSLRYSKRGGDGAVASLYVHATDAPVVTLGEPHGFPVPIAPNIARPWAAEPSLAEHGVSSMWWNNLWGTNYVQWLPYREDGAEVVGEDTILSRYELAF